jgi:hypothetical protein
MLRFQVPVGLELDKKCLTDRALRAPLVYQRRILKHFLTCTLANSIISSTGVQTLESK